MAVSLPLMQWSSGERVVRGLHDCSTPKKHPLLLPYYLRMCEIECGTYGPLFNDQHQGGCPFLYETSAWLIYSTNNCSTPKEHPLALDNKGYRMFILIKGHPQCVKLNMGPFSIFNIKEEGPFLCENSAWLTVLFMVWCICNRLLHQHNFRGQWG